MLKSTQKIGVNSQARVDIGSAPGWAGASGIAAGGTVGVADGVGEGVGPGEGVCPGEADGAADAATEGVGVASGENCGVQAAMATITTIEMASGTSSGCRRIPPTRRGTVI